MNNMLIATRGFMASGKTTWAEDAMKVGNTVNINRDDIRMMLGVPMDTSDKTGENQVTKVSDAMIHAAMVTGKNVIVSNTNLRDKDLKALVRKADEFGYEFAIKDFKEPLDVLITRDAARDRTVGGDVIRKVWERFPYSRWKTTEQIVNAARGTTVEKVPFNNDPDLEHAVLVDIDGTLAHMHDRSPFDWARVGEDTVDSSVREAVNILHDHYRIIVMSGRDSVCRSETISWLEENGIHYDEIHMRPAGDTRPDWQIKDDLLTEFVEGQYHVVFALDDRQQVVDHYRARGIKVFQVEPGDF